MRARAPREIRRRSMSYLLLALLPLLPFQDALHPVTRVLDGDTIEVEVGGERERVRYIGIDTPETDHAREVVRRLAARATEANEALVAGREVRLELDAERRDRYGRLLAYVWVGDTLVNERLLREGYAQVYTRPPNVRYADRFLAAQRSARAEGLGLWDAAADVTVGEGAPEPGIRVPEIAAADADDHVGELAVVCGRVVGARHVPRARGSPTFLNFERPHPRQLFTVVIWEGARARFEVPPERRFEGREACAEGRIELHRGTPQIVIEDPDRHTLRPR